jgi:hypothetical protein
MLYDKSGKSSISFKSIVYKINTQIGNGTASLANMIQ